MYQIEQPDFNEYYFGLVHKVKIYWTSPFVVVINKEEKITIKN